MFKLACPSCGAEVAFRSATSAIAVCEYCRSTLLREADAVRDVGKMSAVLEDYSPLRIGVSGVYSGRAFGVIGRIQLRYDAGFWNEWYIGFDDGSAGWLSDASGQYAVTLDAGLADDAPPFKQLVPGGQYRHDGVVYIAADLRSARCSGGEGELPFRVGAGWEATVADYRQTHRFLTLDYSDGFPPRRYAGKAVSLADLKCQLLREPDEIARSAGHLKGAAEALACPACGASIAWSPGVAEQLHCPACGVRSAVSGGTAEALDGARRAARVATTLALGDTASFDKERWQIIGLLRCREQGGTEEWTEYLLYSPQAGFLWLVESDAGWDKVRVLDNWPESVSASAVRLDGAAFTRMQAYGAEVIYAAGAFNWRVKVGDKVSITDYRSPRGTLTSEQSKAELGWSLAQRVPASTVDGWFGKSGKLAAAAALGGPAPGKSDAPDRAALRPLAWVFTVLVLLTNVPIAVMGGLYSWVLILLAIGVLWLPVFTDWVDG
ncbi:MAG: DUF4178 domain-containing protein [Zoogloea sp.]|uniref:DUF4178 domain-containing protein n=1 Tax=Zoogloea sp. TaxID=49181 RepID=UPI00262B1818|nr:DUF4178 domain-containing protein [Zoogloea sp.]MDD3328171.1 DUF4178 domain-containing protein [Zoogloea sp.]